MFRITFKDIEKPLLKANKALKNKKGFTLMEGESQIEKAKKLLKDTVNVTVVLTDMEKELDYVIDNIKVYDVSLSIIALIEDKLAVEDHEEAHNVLRDFKNAYEEESLKAKSETRSGKKSRFKFGKNKEEAANNSIPDNSIAEEFEEMDIEKAYESPSLESNEESSVLDQFQNIDEEVREPDFESELTHEFEEEESDPSFSNEPIQEVSEDEHLVENNNDYNFDNFEENHQANEDEFETDYEEDISEVSKSKPEKKNDRVIFPNYDSYIDLSDINKTISRFSSRFDENYLLKLIGINPNVDLLDNLEKKKLEFAKTGLNESEFILLSDYFYQSIEGIKERTTTVLKSEYEKALATDYEYLAEGNLKEKFDAIREESQKELNDYLSQQEDEVKIKREKLEMEQQKELDDLLKRQKLEMAQYDKELNEKKDVRVSIYKDNIEEKAKDKKEELIDQEMFNLKYQSVNSLSEVKRQGIVNFEKQLETAIDDIWPKYESEMDKLKESIKNNVPKWEVEVRKQEEQEYAQREEQRKQQALDIEREKIALERQKIQNNSQPSQEEKYGQRLESILNKFEQSTIAMNQIQPSPLYPNYQQPYQSPEQKIDEPKADEGKKRSVNNAMIAGGIALFLITGGVVVSTNVANTGAETVEASSNVEYNELASSINKLEEMINSNDSTEHEESPELQELLKSRNYSEALAIYNDKESLNRIETGIYENKDLDELKSFNDSYKSSFGKLDQYLLEKDTKKILNEFENLSEDKMADLTEERKENIAFHLYSEDRGEDAQALLNSNNDSSNKEEGEGK